jgi:hypothetical protein
MKKLTRLYVYDSCSAIHPLYVREPFQSSQAGWVSLPRLYRGACLTILALLLSFCSLTAQNYAANPQEFVGPFPTWINVKVKYGAKGDGTSDDTGALQRAFDELGKGGENDPKVLYLPAGTYRISAGLRLAGRKYISIIGEDPLTTKIKWAGPSGGIMFTLNGVAYSRFGRITWDGSKTAHTAVAHFWDGSTGYAVTHNEHADEIFMDVGHGLRGGKPHTMDAETSVLRCRFIRNTIAGVSIESFNALDWYIWDSYFEDCKIGVTNNAPSGGAGNFHVFHSIFKRSTYADISMKNTMYFSVRENYSTGSKAFFVAEPIGQNGGPITLQKNIILDAQDATPIRFGNKGPISLLDNIIRSRDGQAGPVIQSMGDLLTVGNIFTVSQAVSTTEKWIAIEDVVQSRTGVNPSEPLLQATPRKQSRKVFELLPGWVDGQFQKTIDSAAAYAGQRPVIHLRPGPYSITKPVVIPAGSDIQLIGDGYDARLDWRGAAGGDVLRLEGADKVVLEEFTINGNYNARGNGLVIRHSDQGGKQVFMEGVTVWSALEGSLLMQDFTNSQAELHNFNHSDSPVASVQVSKSKLAIFAGSSSNNALSYQLTSGGSLMVQDIWYESGNQKNFVQLTGAGNFTLNGAKVYASSTPDTPVNIDNFNGKVTFLGVDMNGKFTVKGTGTHTSALALGMQFGTQNAYSNSSASAKAAMLNSRIYSGGSYPLSNIGAIDAAFIKSMLSEIRSWRPAYKTSSGLLVHRLNIGHTKKGIQLLPASTPTTPTNQLPSVSLTAPSTNSHFVAPASIPLSATASDADGGVSKVEFFQGSTKLGEDLSSPYSFTWSNVAAGNYTISAKATDDKGGISSSSPVSVLVSSTTTPAIVSFSLINADTKQPIAGFDPLLTQATIDLAKLPTKNLNIRANTNPATVGSVRFGYDGNASYALENTPTYDLAGNAGWTPSLGSHTLTATPYSASNATGTAGKALSISFQVTQSSTLCSGTGGITREYWANISGSTLSAIPLSSTPTSVTQLSSFEAPINTGDNYGARIRGYVCVPVSGNYSFYVSADDYAELWLSTDANPVSKRKIASVSGWTQSREWTKYTSQRSGSIYLSQGVKYYIEALHKENAGGDNLAVGWIAPSSAAITVISGNYLIPFSTQGSRLDSGSQQQLAGAELALRVYPNPMEGRAFSIAMQGLPSGQSLLISIQDVSGKVIYSRAHQSDSYGQLEEFIKLPARISAGMYILTILSPSEQWSRKIMIK